MLLMVIARQWSQRQFYNFPNKRHRPYKTPSASCYSFSVVISLIQFSSSRLCFMIYTSKLYCYSHLKSRYYLLLHSGIWRVCLTNTIYHKICHHTDLPYFAMYNVHPCTLGIHIFGPKSQEKIFHFNFLIQLFIYIQITCFLYYKGILAFIVEHFMVQEVLCNK